MKNGKVRKVGERPFPQKVTEGPSTAQIALQGPITGLKLTHNSTSLLLISGSAYYIKVCGPVETLHFVVITTYALIVNISNTIKFVDV